MLDRCRSFFPPRETDEVAERSSFALRVIKTGITISIHKFLSPKILMISFCIALNLLHDKSQRTFGARKTIKMCEIYGIFVPTTVFLTIILCMKF